jgi:hypothetical protein
MKIRSEESNKRLAPSAKTEQRKLYTSPQLKVHGRLETITEGRQHLGSAPCKW